MNKPVTIALDAMGGDFGVSVVVPAAVDALASDSSLRLLLVGDVEAIGAELQRLGRSEGERLRIQPASQVVEMDDLPSMALRTKKDSSMRVAIDQVKSGNADACVSAGNTGALMAIARFVLKMLPGIDRPAICTALPTIAGHTHMLDLGANAECSAEQLFQFAVMGSVLASAVDNIERPTVGLLNIGEEEIKGNEVVKDAARLLSASELNYTGYVEGDGIYKGAVDVVVCDGFTGNVSLKTGEGLAKMVRHFLQYEFGRGIFTKLAALVAYPVLKAFSRRLDPRRYNGASLLGLKGIVIKSHGGADVLAFANAIKIASLEVKKAVPERIASRLGELLPQEGAQ